MDPRKAKGPVPVPPIQVYARPRGGIQWQCPDCGNLHSKNAGFWRRAQIRCSDPSCSHKFRIGIGLTVLEGQFKCLFMGKWENNLANRMEAHVPWDGHGVGSIYGPIDWTCPNCGDTQTTVVNRRDLVLKCPNCAYWWFVQLLIYKPAGSKVLCPYDWTPFYVGDTKETPAPAKVDSRSGETGESPRNHSGDTMS